MKRIIFLISLLLITGSVIWGQGQITRPKKIEPAKKETPKQTKETIPTQPKREEPVYIQEVPLPIQVKPSNEETINGIKVSWASDVTSFQKSIITNLLNNMVYVQGGSFMMGSDDPYGSSHNKPLHQENVRSFRINKYEIDQKTWSAIMGNNPSYFDGEDLPVESISWDDCQIFINKINEKTNLKFRLPTEIEWEYSAQGGSQSQGFLYSGSNNIDEIGWIYENSNGTSHKVGTKNPNELGLYDMSGNVGEFTSQHYSENYKSPRNNNSYVIRGGSWSSNEKYARIYSRDKLIPSNVLKTVGFRLAL